MTALDFAVLADGYELVEGPRVGPDGAIWFTDVLGGGVHRFADGSVETVVPKRRGVGGLALHEDGGVVVTGRDLVHIAPDGTNRTLWSPDADVTGINDCCALPDGRVVLGALTFKPFAGEAPTPGRFVCVGTDESDLFVDDVDWPNGCGATADRFFACDYHRGVVHVRDGEGTRIFAHTPSGEADGLAIDDEGGVWVAQPRAGSLVRLTPDGDVERVLDVPGHTPASLAFDGEGGLLVTTIAGPDRSGALLRAEAPIPGPRHLLARI
jgi:gluconolactonase